MPAARAGETALGAPISNVTFSGAGPHIEPPSGTTLLVRTSIADGAAANASREDWNVGLASPAVAAAVKTFGWIDNVAAFQEIAAFVPRENYSGARGLIARVASGTNFVVGKSVAGSYATLLRFGGSGYAAIHWNGTDKVHWDFPNNRFLISDTFIEMDSQAEPAAPGASKGRVFMELGAVTPGKMSYLVRFPSGVSQVLATEP